jgi:integrase
VKALLATAVEDGLLRANPSAGIRITGAATSDTEERVKVLSVEQLEGLLGQIPEERLLLVRLIATTGVRISEALGLRWRDLDMPARRLFVRQRIRAGKAGAPKSSAGRREVPVAAEIIRELAALRLRSPWSGDDAPVFAREDGRPIADRSTYRWLKPAAARAGVPWVAWHVLRHTAATRWLLSGVTIPQVSRLLGHQDPGFTLRTYISVMPADLRTARPSRPRSASRERSRGQRRGQRTPPHSAALGGTGRTCNAARMAGLPDPGAHHRTHPRGLKLLGPPGGVRVRIPAPVLRRRVARYGAARRPGPAVGTEAAAG